VLAVFDFAHFPLTLQAGAGGKQDAPNGQFYPSACPEG